ncbi:hypothetical protein GS930_03625 [Rhodococcus hoagii]|nr:hypothetical protein [Prescottella equi]
MDKVGTQVIPGASSGRGPTPSRSPTGLSDPASRRPRSSDNSLVASAAMTVTYSAKVTFQTGGVGSLVQFHLAKNETELVASANTGGTLTGTISLNPGDTLSRGAPATAASATRTAQSLLAQQTPTSTGP